MFLTNVDKKMLRILKKTQVDLNQFIIIDEDNQVCYRSDGWNMGDIDNAANSSIRTRLPFPPAVISCSVSNLFENELLEKQKIQYVYQITYKGWYNSSVRKAEQLSMLLNNVFFPAVVAVASSIITTLLMQLITTGCI